MVPQVAVCGEESAAAEWFGPVEGVERAGASGRHEGSPGWKSLHRKTIRVKLNSHMIVTR